jgi:quercetin dioxygenase-like cupin family protein
MASIHDPTSRAARIQDDCVHVLPLDEYARELRHDPEFERDGRAGAIMMKTPELRVILECLDAGSVLASHVIHGPAMLQVIDGELRLETDLTAHTAHAGDMVSLPRDIARKLIAMKPSTFLLTLSPEK